VQRRIAQLIDIRFVTGDDPRRLGET